MVDRLRPLIWVAALVIVASACATETEDAQSLPTTATTLASPPTTATTLGSPPTTATTLASLEASEAAMEAAEAAMVAEAVARREATAAAEAMADAMSEPADPSETEGISAASDPQTKTAPTAPEGFNQIGGSATVNDAPYDLTFFEHYGVNPFVDTEDDHLSTFATDVDTASYAVARFFVQEGYLPDPASVRVEEFVNYFDYGYETPVEGAFAIHIEGSRSRFGGERHWLLRVGLQGETVPEEERKDATLVFAIDVSGSMDRGDRLGLVKESLALLVGKLRPSDEVAIVVYGDQGRVQLAPTDGGEKESIMQAINALQPGGSTYAEQGLRLAYQLASQRAQPERITRVFLLSDGVANVGRTGAVSILNEIRPYVDQGVTLTTIGFGMGNFNDVLMEQLVL